MRKLTDEEERRYKKHNRLIRNRESAQKSRMKKRQYVDKLEAHIKELEKQKAAVEKQLQERDRQVESLKQENAHLRSKLGLSEKEKDTKSGKKSAVLFAVLFSFAFVLFGMSSFGLKPLAREELVSLPARTMSHVQPEAHFEHSSKRHLNGALMDNQSVAQVSGPEPAHRHRHSDAHTLRADTPIVKKKESVASPVKLDDSMTPVVQEKKEERKKISILDNSAKRAHSISSQVSESSIVTTSENGMVRRKHNSAPLARPEYEDASYIYCSEAKRISRGSSKSPVVGFLIPTNFLNGTNLMFEDGVERPPLVEVTCSVMDIYPVYPIGQESSRKH